MFRLILSYATFRPIGYRIQICKNVHLMGSHYVYRVYRKTTITVILIHHFFHSIRFLINNSV